VLRLVDLSKIVAQFTTPAESQGLWLLLPERS
jgi:hypothetical protein